MKAQPSAYSFAILRYVHDVVSSEFVNVGVLVYAPQLKFLGAKCMSSYSRIADFFGGIDGAHYRALVRYIQDAVEQAKEHYGQGLPLYEMPSSIEKFAASILPPDDSAFQFSPRAGGGLTSDPNEALQRIYDRYVVRHVERTDRPRRDDDQVLAMFKQPLREKSVLPQLRAKKIEAPLYAHEFPLAWKNGVWNVCEPISFDLMEGSAIRDKANHWVGRATTLAKASIEFKMFLLVGRPTNPELWDDFSNARTILREIPVKHEVFGEDQASSFADLVTAELRQHPQQWVS